MIHVPPWLCQLGKEYGGPHFGPSTKVFPLVGPDIAFARSRTSNTASRCMALPEHLMESELFGHVAGAFTGATHTRKGLFLEANGGTLDEIAEMPPALQGKLLRVLEDGDIRAVGSNRTKHVDVRIVAATNRDLKTEVEEGRFRQSVTTREASTPQTFGLPESLLREKPLVSLAEIEQRYIRHVLTRSMGTSGKWPRFSGSVGVRSTVGSGKKGTWGTSAR